MGWMLVADGQARKIRNVAWGEPGSAVRPVPGGQRPEGSWLGRGRLATTSRVGLNLPPDLKLADWRHIGHQILVIADSSAWWIGDWLVFGQNNYPGRYRHAMQETSLDYQTLKNYAWVARRFPLPSRRTGLSFQHHIEVAAVPVPERDVWLDRAQHFRWSRNELRRQLRLAKPRPQDGDGCPGAEVTLSLTPPRLSQWESAAGATGRSLAEWIIEVADDAASTTLGSAQKEIGA